ncbi:hypothetical protein C0993_012710 [Termitomyces sp. T159_Od127]|nr:hypothetical protein C0993_012710 [Termitomyces sp. T159_Od127]
MVQLRTVEHQEFDDPMAQETGPPEAEDTIDTTENNQEPVFTRGFIPNMHTRETEMEQLRNAAHDDLPLHNSDMHQLYNAVFNNNGPVILTMPNVQGTPVNEYSTQGIAIDAFPTLFCTGKGDISELCDIEVTMEEWAAHLIRLDGGQFAQHSCFRYWALNTAMCQKAKKASQWYLTTYKDDRQLKVEDIQEMIDSDEAHTLANCISHAGEKLPGSKPFWIKAQHELISQICSPECGSPHVFFTASSADIQWPDMHQHMPNFDPDQGEDASAY